MDGQITITDYLKSQIELRKVKDLTEWINTQGKSQYEQVGDIVEKYITDEEMIRNITNAVSVYILEMSLGYMKYLREESNGRSDVNIRLHGTEDG